MADMEVPLDINEFEVIVTFVTLARSGRFHKRKSLFDEMKRIFPSLTDKDIHKVCNEAIKSLTN
ncbi:hypothetical protein [Salmonella phage SSBI34]|nr:hypothetical protein [Salmonella phage SSBI34]